MRIKNLGTNGKGSTDYLININIIDYGKIRIDIRGVIYQKTNNSLTQSVYWQAYNHNLIFDFLTKIITIKKIYKGEKEISDIQILTFWIFMKFFDFFILKPKKKNNFLFYILVILNLLYIVFFLFMGEL